MKNPKTWVPKAKLCESVNLGNSHVWSKNSFLYNYILSSFQNVCVCMCVCVVSVSKTLLSL